MGEQFANAAFCFVMLEDPKAFDYYHKAMTYPENDRVRNPFPYLSFQQQQELNILLIECNDVVWNRTFTYTKLFVG